MKNTISLSSCLSLKSFGHKFRFSVQLCLFTFPPSLLSLSLSLSHSLSLSLSFPNVCVCVCVCVCRTKQSVVLFEAAPPPHLDLRVCRGNMQHIIDRLFCAACCGSPCGECWRRPNRLDTLAWLHLGSSAWIHRSGQRDQLHGKLQRSCRVPNNHRRRKFV